MKIGLDSFNGHASQYHNMAKRIEGETIRNQKIDLTVTKKEIASYARSKRIGSTTRGAKKVKPLPLPF